MLTPENITNIKNSVSKMDNEKVLELFTSYYSRITNLDTDDMTKFRILKDEVLRRMESK